MNGVLFIVPVSTSRMGGMEIYCDQLAAAMGTQLNGNVALLPVDDPRPMKAVAQAPYRLLSMARLHQLPSRTLRKHLIYRWANWVASRAIRAQRLDFVLCGYAHMLPLAAEIARQNGIPYGVVGHGIEVWGSLAPHKEAALRKIGWGIGVSHFTVHKMAERGIDPTRLFVVHPHVDTQKYYPDPAAGQALRQKHGWKGKTVLLTLARLSATERYKGHDVVIQALHAARRTHPDLLYAIAGSGDDQPRLEALVAKWGVTRQVQFLGRIAEEDKRALYNAADLFIMPSHVRQQDNRWTGEGFGIVFIEASACGKPVIGPNQGGAVDAIEDGVTGLTVDPEDVAAVQAAIQKLAEDPKLRQRFGEQGRQRSVRLFDLKTLPNQVKDIFHALSQKPVAV